MFENVFGFFKKIGKKDRLEEKSKDTAKERLHLVLMQDRANVSADFLDMMRQEIIEVIKKYIDVDERDIDVRLTNKTNEDGTTGAPALYANIPIAGIKENVKQKEQETKKQDTEAEVSSKIENNQESIKEDTGDLEESKCNNEDGEVVEEEKTENPEKIEADNIESDIQIENQEKEEQQAENKEQIESKEKIKSNKK